MFHLGYNTNGLAHHRVLDALDLCAGLGYQAVSLTPDAGQPDPYDLRAGEAAAVRERAREHRLELTVETGSRFLLDPGRKHFPTLMEEGAQDRLRRVDFLRRCVDLAVELRASPVAFWSGAAPGSEVGDGPEEAPAALWERLAAGVEAVLEHARGSGVSVAFEPEPGMFLERPSGYERLVELLGPRGTELGLCLDVGHLLCTGDLPVEKEIARLAGKLAIVHLDDIKDGVHEHRMFGEGDLDLRATLTALRETGFDGVAAVELSRDAHRGPWAAAEAYRRLREAME